MEVRLNKRLVIAEEKKVQVEKETKSVVKVALKKTSGKGVQDAKVVSRIEKQYKEEVVPALMKEFTYSSIMECPKLVKIVLNMRLLMMILIIKMLKKQ